MILVFVIWSMLWLLLGDLGLSDPEHVVVIFGDLGFANPEHAVVIYDILGFCCPTLGVR